jgi:hypothetical protein
MAHGGTKLTLPVNLEIHYFPVSLASSVSESLALYPDRKHVRFSKQKVHIRLLHKQVQEKDPLNVGRDS